uniref:Extracellular matrix protein 1a n=2 Tax=Kryptolebias marmoratus TaxID=37003 RepID=A0A3Q3ASK6_KRYMA
CLQSQSRPRYPNSFFPASGFSYFRRLGSTINRLESWYSLCCSGLVAQQTIQILCCTQQAWKQALSRFCIDEFSVKTSPYECCEYKDEERWTCFNSQLPNPHYFGKPGYTSPPMPAEPGFSFNP